jgi:hypothetical protein
VLVCAPALASEMSCKPVLDAQRKQAQTAFHETSTSNGAALLEKIFTTKALYLRRGSGHWIKVPTTPQDLIDAMKESGMALSSCHRMREEAVEGQAATVWAAHLHTGNPVKEMDMQIWISSATGLPLRTESSQRGAHVSTHLAYDNVQPPPGVQ